MKEFQFCGMVMRCNIENASVEVTEQIKELFNTQEPFIIRVIGERFNLIRNNTLPSWSSHGEFKLKSGGFNIDLILLQTPPDKDHYSDDPPPMEADW